MVEQIYNFLNAEVKDMLNIILGQIKKGENLPTFPFSDIYLSYFLRASLISVRSSTSVGPAGAATAGFLTLL